MKLDVVSSSLTASSEFINSGFREASTGKGVGLGYYTNGAGTNVQEARVRALSNVPLVLGTTTTPQAVTILDSGKVGIGVTLPTAKLEVAGGDIRINGSTSGYVGLRAPAVAGSGILTLPATVGTSGQTLVTDGSGVLSWATASGGGSGFPVALGTSAAPSMNFSGDTDTGFYSPGADTVAVSTSGVERVRITSTGYVGIGTTSPEVPFTVDTGVNSPIKIVNNVDNPYHYLLLGRYTYLNAFNDGSETLNLYYDGNMNKGLYFIYGSRQSDPLNAGYPARLTFSRRGGLDVMTLDQSGNVGIGTTSPTARLEVAGGDIRINGSTSGYVGLRAPAVAGSGILTLPSTVGTSGQTLVTDGSGILSWATAGGSSFPIALGTSAAPSMNFSGDTDTGFYSPLADNVAISTGGLERLRVDASGYVGIGTTAPSRQLYLSTSSAGLVYQLGLENHQGGGATGILFNVDGNGSNGPAPQRGKGGLVYEATDGWSRGRFMFLQNSAADLSVASLSDAVFSIANDGEVKAVKAVNGDLGGRLIISNPYDNSYGVTHSALFMDAQKKAGILKVTTTNWGVGDLYFVQNNVTDSSTYSLNNPAMVIKSDGNIGIGTTAPSALFTVDNGTTIGTYTTTGWVHTSDARLKKDVKTIDGALEKVTQLRGVEYKFKKDKENKPQLGFIAQETEKVFPQAVVTGSDGIKSMNYANLVAPVVEALKEMHIKFLALFKKSEVHDRELASLKSKTEALEKENAQLKDYLCKKDPQAPICKK